MRIALLLLAAALLFTIPGHGQKRARDYGISIGVIPTGANNAITDVSGVMVGHTTLIRGDSVRTGVTVILPHGDGIFQQKVPSAVFVGNGFGKLAGSTQINELGNLETPIVLTNTLSVATAMEAVISYTLSQPGNEDVYSVNAVVGETNDSYLNDIRGRHVGVQDVLDAIKGAQAGPVAEGSIGAGTGTVCFGYKGGIGTTSRRLPENLGGYTIGVLVQTNFGGILQIDGVPVGEALGRFSFKDQLFNNVDGSCMIIVATDAPLDHRNLERLAKRAFLGLGKTGGIVSHGSGDYVVAFSTHPGVRIAHQPDQKLVKQTVLHQNYTSPLFMAAIEATEEAIINSLFAATSVTGIMGHQVVPIPLDKVLSILKKYKRIK